MKKRVGLSLFRHILDLIDDGGRIFLDENPLHT